MNGMLFVFLGVSCSDTTFLTRHQVSFDVEVVPSEMAQVSISPIHKLLMALPRSIGLGGFTVVLVGECYIVWLVNNVGYNGT